MSDRELFNKLREGGAKYDMISFINALKGRLVTAQSALDETVNHTPDPSEWDLSNPLSRPIKQPAVRRVLNALVEQGRALKKSRAYKGKDAFYILTDEELEQEGVTEDNVKLRKIIARRNARKSSVVIEDFGIFDDEDEEEFDDDEEEP